MNPILEQLDHFIKFYNEYIGCYLVLILLVPTGIYFTIKYRFLQVSHFGHALKLVAGKYNKRKIPAM